MKAYNHNSNNSNQSSLIGKYLSMSTKQIAFILLCIAQLVFSGWHVLGAALMSPSPLHKPVSSASFTFARQVLSTIVLVTFSWIQDSRSLFSLQRKDLPMVIAAGMFGACLMPLLYLQGLSMTSPAITAVWDGPVLPIFVFIGAILLGSEQLAPSGSLRLRQIISLVLAVICSIAVLCFDEIVSKVKKDVAGDNDDNGDDIAIDADEDMVSSDASDEKSSFNTWLFGNLILCLMVSCYAAMTILQRSLRSYNSISLTAWMFVVGSVADAFILSVTSELGAIGSLYEVAHACNVNKLFMTGLFYSVMFVTVLNFSILAYTSKSLSSTTVSLFACTQPAITVILEWIASGKSIHLVQLLSSIGIVVGMRIFTSVQDKISASLEHPV